MASKKLMAKDTDLYDKYKKNVEGFDLFIDYIENSNLKKNTKVTKINHLTLYCCSQDKNIEDLLEEAKIEEKSVKELVNRKICKRLEDFEQYLKDAGYTDKTVSSRVKTVRSFYRRELITVPTKDLRPLLNPKLREEIKNSNLFKEFVEYRNLTNESTISGYLTSLTGYCDYYGMSIDELVEEAEKDEENNVRIKKRKIKKRLIEYRNYLYANQFSNKTVKSKMTNIKFFFHSCDIDIPKLGKKENVPYDRNISFDEVPKKEHVKKAIETTSSIKNRALFLFCMCSCSGSAEAREFTIEEYIRGVKGIEDKDTIEDIDIDKVLDEVEKDLNEALDNLQNQTEAIVPVFHFVRKKRKRDYFTCITPEANQYILNYLKTREGLTLKDKVFDYSRKSLIRAFQSVNDKNKWGWVNRNRQRFFTSHQLRRLGANLIDNEKLVNEISGRKFDETTEAYFKRDKTKIRKEYFKWLDELTIYQKYRINFMTDEKYATFAQELKTAKEEKEEYARKVSLLEKELKEQGQQIEETKETLVLITKEKTYNSIYDSINDYVMTNLFYENPDEEELVVLLATDYAVEHKDEFDYTDDYIKRIIKRVRLQIEFDGRPIQNQLNSYFLTSNGVGMELQHNIQLVLDKIMDSEKIMDILGDSVDLMKLEDLIEKELSKYDEDLSDEDVNNIILDVAMQY